MTTDMELHKKLGVEERAGMRVQRRRNIPPVKKYSLIHPPSKSYGVVT